jgi:ATP-dependent helicase HrpB
LASGLACDGKILILSPRRVAARAAAARMADALGERVGDTVGLRVRLETRVSKSTRIEVMTEGVFTRTLLSDPALDGVAAVLFDEFHERSLDADTGLALALDAQAGLREDLRLLVMSATLDGARVAALMGDCPVIESQGRAFPVSLRYLGSAAGEPIEAAMAAAVRQALREEQGGILCFLPGAGEIERTRTRLHEMGLAPHVDVWPLYGALDPKAQDCAIAPAVEGRRKVVLATSIAETSLTLEGLRVVIDSGLTRRPQYEPATGLTRLVTVRVSQASATQRAGRAGRLGPGVCYRLWQEGETRALPRFDRPEMLDADMAGLALDLAEWGVCDPRMLAFLDQPPAPAWAEAITLLRALGALDCDGRITTRGRAMVAIPAAPRLAAMVVAARAGGQDALGAHLAMVLSEQGLGGRDRDLRTRLEVFARDRGARAESARRAAHRLGGGSDFDIENAGAIVARAFPERVAKARGKPGEFLMANGRAAIVDATDSLAREKFLAIAEVSGRADRAHIQSAAPLDLATIETMFADTIVMEDVAQLESGVARAKRVRRLGKIVLAEAPLAALSPELQTSLLLDSVRANGLSALPWSDAAANLRARVALMKSLEAESWPDWSDAALMQTLEIWLAPHLSQVRALSDLDLDSVLRLHLAYGLQRQLDQDAPVRFETPAGATHTIDYVCDGAPAVSVKLQEMFGQPRHPTIANGRVKLLLLLLSPARRPIQTTRDLPGFWAGSYKDVRADMRGRYPKHPWPEDPLAAPPTLRAKLKGS